MSKDKTVNAEEVVEALARIGEPEPAAFAGTALYDTSHWQSSPRKLMANNFAKSIDKDYMRGTALYGQELEGPRQEEK